MAAKEGRGALPPGLACLTFATPWLLAGLALLPPLWWLLRASPPPPRQQVFPAIALLLDLAGTQTTPARTPWWLLALRLAAAGLAIVGLAGPVRHAPPAASASLAPVAVLLVIDDGWAAAPDWSDRLRAATSAIATLSGPAQLRLLTTAPSQEGSTAAAGPAMAAADLAARLAALRPLPWPTDRGSLAPVLRALPAASRVIYVSDGLAGPSPAGDQAFAAALSRFAGVTELRGATPPLLLRPPQIGPDRLTLRVDSLPGSAAAATLRATDPAGQTLAELAVPLDAAGGGTAALALPPGLRNRVAALRVAGHVSAGGVVLLDEASHRRPVGLLTTAAGDTPLTGPLFYVRRALADSTELRAGPAATLLDGGVSVIVAADQLFADAAVVARLTAWVRQGGVLVRFAGPALAAAAAPDPLLPARLLVGDRALGGAMSWSQPAQLAPFPAGSPFAGLAVPPDVRISRQVLTEPGDPSARPAQQDWAALADGTPLVTAAALGAGQLVLFHVTANAEWSNLPLSGLFPDMLHRLVALSAGIRPQARDAVLAPLRALDGFGVLGPPGPAAQAIAAAAIPLTQVQPHHPPGLYGPADSPMALNLGAALPPLAAMPLVLGAAEHGLSGAPTPVLLGPRLLAAALLLLAFDLLLTLRMRGLLWACLVGACLVGAGLVGTLMLARPVVAADLPSLATHLAFVVTGDPQADGVSEAGLRGLSAAVNQRTAAALADPVAIDPSRDELSFYPLLYWRVLSATPVPDGDTLARLDDYMQNGGIIVFDTGGANATGAGAALQRIGLALAIPPLIQLTTAHVLSRSFYLLRDWPGRLDGAPVWVARDADRANDGVSPVVVGANDWAAAWATDAAGTPQYDVDGGDTQRELATRFGINLVIYALTGNYKADQLHVPELLRRLGEQPDAGPGAPP